MLGHNGSFQHPYSHVGPRTGGRHGREKKDGNLLGNLAQPSLLFVSASVETMGSFGEDTIVFLYQVTSHIQAISNDPIEYLKLCQRFSVCKT